jgi:hypothetical protein
MGDVQSGSPDGAKLQSSARNSFLSELEEEALGNVNP